MGAGCAVEDAAPLQQIVHCHEAHPSVAKSGRQCGLIGGGFGTLGSVDIGPGKRTQIWKLVTSTYTFFLGAQQLASAGPIAVIVGPDSARNVCRRNDKFCCLVPAVSVAVPVHD